MILDKLLYACFLVYNMMKVIVFTSSWCEDEISLSMKTLGAVPGVRQSLQWMLVIFTTIIWYIIVHNWNNDMIQCWTRDRATVCIGWQGSQIKKKKVFRRQQGNKNRQTTTARKSPVLESQEHELAGNMTMPLPVKPPHHSRSSETKLLAARPTSQQLCVCFRDADCVVRNILMRKSINLQNQTCLLINQHTTHTATLPQRSPSGAALRAHLIRQLVQLLQRDMIWKCERSQIILSWGDKSSTVPTSPDSLPAK